MLTNNKIVLSILENIANRNLEEAEYQGRKVTLNKPMQGDVKKFKVYVKNEKGNVVKVNFGDPDMRIKKSNPERRKSFRARHKCDQKKDKTTASYWSCLAWNESVQHNSETIEEAEYQGKTVKLNQPVQISPDKFKVYVKDKKDNIIRIYFDKTNVNKKDPESRKAYSDKHNCQDEKDRTDPDYWECSYATKPSFWSCKAYRESFVRKVIKKVLLELKQ
jgi:hypothetical protein